MKESLFINLKNKIKKAEDENILLLYIHGVYSFLMLKILGAKKYTELKYKIRIGKGLDLENPQTFNEKINWLKLYYYQPYFKLSSDKYLVRKYLKDKIGENLCPKLLYVSRDMKDFSIEKIKEFPCILKISNGCGTNLIIHDKDEFDDKYLKKKIRQMVLKANIHARYGCEPQYLKGKPYIIVERLLADSNGKIPNDYKFFYINGKLTFIYVSVDRMGLNVRHLYDSTWNRMDGILLENATKEKYKRHMSTPSVECPEGFERMKQIGDRIALDFPLVRIDFYDVDGKVYVGEITLHHGSGNDRFCPEKLDFEFGNMLQLPAKNFELKI